MKEKNKVDCVRTKFKKITQIFFQPLNKEVGYVIAMQQHGLTIMITTEKIDECAARMTCHQNERKLHHDVHTKLSCKVELILFRAHQY